MARFGVIGAGSWGTALAIILQINRHEIFIWNRDQEVLKALHEDQLNHKYLPGIRIPEQIRIEPDLQKVTRETDGLIFAVPSHTVRHVIEQIGDVDPNTVLISVVKGIENDTLLRMSEVLAENFPDHRIAVISGPSHAEEAARGVPTLVVCASEDHETATRVQEAFMSPKFRVYRHTDVIGVELGGALKNIIAVAAGIIDGVIEGDNTKAALITRALAEMTRLGTKMGADSLTFAGLSGMGDLIVTCMSKYSRNRYLGEQIGQGRKLNDVLDEMVMVAEGVKTTRSAYEMAMKNKVEVPIITETYRVLFEDKDPKTAVYDLMTREAKIEDWG